MTDGLQRYSEFAPTGFDSKGAFLPDRQDWFLAPVSRTRDSGALSESNFEAALEYLGGESDSVEVHRFGHWGPGWFEIILVHPTAESKPGVRFVDLADELARSLADYPCLDEEDFSRREWEEASEAWMNLGLGDRMDLCRDNGVSVFSARRDYLPSEDSGGIFEALVRC